MFDFFKRKKCEHDYEFVRNIYGDDINWCGGYRSEWRCKKCGKTEFRRYLHEVSTYKYLNNLYNEYYINKYLKWVNLRSSTLTKLMNQMIESAKQGEGITEFILFCEEEYNDRNYYEKWFKENNLKVEVELCGNEKCENVNKYLFKVNWF